MTLHHIEELEKYGNLIAFYTDRSHTTWPCNEPDKNSDYEDLQRELALEMTNFVRIPQTHSAGIIQVTNDLKGIGIISDAPSGYDGMITDCDHTLLCTVEADCVPVYIYDPVKKAAAMVHSGRKGSAELISVNAVRLMQSQYASDPAEMVIAFGPCICKDCYEVGGEVLSEFYENFSQNEIESFAISKGNDKYLLDIKKAIKISLIKEGILEKNIIDNTPCTFESDNLCSYRRDHGKDRMLTAIMLL